LLKRLVIKLFRVSQIAGLVLPDSSFEQVL
jgi:hypothetical protein